jgi:hypothetical protein
MNNVFIDFNQNITFLPTKNVTILPFCIILLNENKYETQLHSFIHPKNQKL